MPFADDSPLLNDAASLRARLDEEGYAVFRGLLPSADILELRRLILEQFDARGWIAADTHLLDGIIDPSIHGVETYASNGVDQQAYLDVYRLEAFHRLAHHPAILALFETVFGEPVLVHPRNIARLMAPHREAVPTPAHQDYIHVQGAKATYTCWIPVGDCPHDLGGLSLLPKTHKMGVLPLVKAEGAGGRAVVLDDGDLEWVDGDLACGDVIVFHSCTVHRSLPNRTENRIRLSCDFRYQPQSQPVEERALEPHGSMITWEETYSGWTGDDLQYYWRDLELTTVEFDPSLVEAQG